MSRPLLLSRFLKSELPCHPSSILRGPRCLPCPAARAYRFASTNSSKPRVLEKPTRYNPPSHGKRQREKVPRTYGPELTSQQQEEQEAKYYPNMMPPEGTFMHWFLMNRGIHLWITLVTIIPRAELGSTRDD